MKRTALFFVCFLYGGILFAQDIITKNDGTDIQAKVLEVEQSAIKYKKFSNLDGPTYTISLSDILMITYENGEREVFNTKRSAFPQGIMTYNSWSGKISVGGETIPNEMVERYFNPDDYALFKSGKSITNVGGIIGVIGAIPFGYSAGYSLGSGEIDNLGLLIGGGAVMAAGFIMIAVGGNKLNKAIANYNAALTFQPEIHFGATPNGIGLAFVF